MDETVVFHQTEPTVMAAKPPLVHIVEDDDVLRRMMAKLFESEGLRTVEHSDGRTALEHASHLQPDLALLDVNLPGMDGITLCAHLRRLETYRRVPIVVLTGVTDDGAVAAAFAAGATDYLSKPVQLVVLKHKAHYLIHAHHAEQQRREVEERLRSIVQYANDAILVLDDALRIIELNPIAETFFGFSVGQSLTDLLDAGRPLDVVLPHLKQTGRSLEAAIKNAQGRTVSVELTCSDFCCCAQRFYTLIMRDITERKRSEGALKDSNQLLTSVLDALPDEVALLDAEGSVLMVNESWRRFAEANGLSASVRHGVGLNYLRLCEQADPEQYPEAQALGRAIRAAIAGQKQRFSLEYPCHTPDEERWFLAQVAALEGSATARVLVSHKNVTVLHPHQPTPTDVLREPVVDESWKLERTLEVLPYGAALMSYRGRIEWMNKQLASLLGEPPGQRRGRRGKDFLSYLGWQQCKQALRPFLTGRLVKHGHPSGLLMRQKISLRKDDGCLLPVILSLSSIEGGRRWLVLVEDLTRQREVDEILRRHNEEWEATVDALPNLILLENTEGKIRRCNRAVSNFLNRPYPAIIGQSSGKLFFGRQSGSLLEAVENASAFQFPNDSRWFQIKSYWIPQERGVGDGWVHILSDITKRRLAEQDMRRLAAAIEQVGEGVVTLDRRGRVQFCNPAFEQLTGIRSWEALGRRFSRLGFGPADTAVRRDILTHLAQGKGWRGHYTARRRDGTTYQEQATVSPVFDAHGVLQNVVVVCRDITEQLRYEAIAEAVNVTESAGYIFSAIRHEMGNPINSIKTALTVLRRAERPSPDMMSTYLDRCLAEVGRVEYLLRTLRSFSMYETLELKAQPLSPFLERFCKLVQEGLAARHIALQHESAAELGLVRFDERALHQALMNLVSNAVDAMAETPTPRLLIAATRYRRLVVVTVRDNGRGLDPEQMKHIFKPFYTSKSHGTGLGLVITRKLLSKMHGTVELRARPEGGCDAVITLEAVDE